MKDHPELWKGVGCSAQSKITTSARNFALPQSHDGFAIPLWSLSKSLLKTVKAHELRLCRSLTVTVFKGRSAVCIKSWHMDDQGAFTLFFPPDICLKQANYTKLDP